VSPSPGRPLDWGLSDEWFTEFITDLEASTVRRKRLWRERVVIPARDQLARDFEQKTEQLRRVIAVERQRWLAESRNRA
jgi:hypothetical protein